MQNTSAHASARQNMVDGQLRPNKVNNPAVLARFSAVPREEFTPLAARAQAYLDQPVPLGQGREMFSPLVAARLIQELSLPPQASVLVLAGGTGYSTALLSGMAAAVTMVEDNAALRQEAELRLSRQPGITFVAQSPAGYTPSASFDAILVDAPFAHLPNLAALVKSLKEGGKLAGVRINALGLPEALILTKHGKSVVEEVLFETKGTCHPAFTAEETFTF